MSEQVEPQPSERQLALLRVVHTHFLEQGYPPSRREIAQKLGVASINTVQGMVNTLIGKGLLLKKVKISRSLLLTEAGRGFL